MSNTQVDLDKIKELARELERYGKEVNSSYRAEIRNTERAISGASSKYYEYSSVTSKVREIQNLLRELERYSKEIEEKNYKLTKGLNNAVNMYRDSERAMKQETDLSRSALSASKLNTKVKQNNVRIKEISEIANATVLTLNADEATNPDSIAHLIDNGVSFINDKLDNIISGIKDLNSTLPFLANEIKNKLDQLYAGLDAKAKKLAEEIKGRLDNVVMITSSYLQKMTQYAASFKEKLDEGIMGAKEIIKQAGEKLGVEELAQLINHLMDVRVGVFNRGIEEFSNIASEFKELIAVKGEQLKSMISDLAEAFDKGAQSLIGDIKLGIDKMGAAISDKLTQLAEAVLLAKIHGEQALLKVKSEIKKSKENLEKDFEELEKALGGDEQAKMLVKELKKWLDEEGYINENYSGSLQDVLKKVAVEVNGEMQIETSAGKITLSGKMVSADGTISNGNTEISGTIDLEGNIKGEATDSSIGVSITEGGNMNIKVNEFQTDEVSGQTKVFIDALGNSTGIEVTMDTKGKQYKEGPYAEVGISWEIKQRELLPQEQEVPVDIPIPVVIDKKWYEKAWDWITDTAIDAWEGVVDGATAAWEGTVNAAETIGNFVEENKEVILTVTAVAAVVVVGVIVVATWPASMVAMGAICTALTPVATNLAYR